MRSPFWTALAATATLTTLLAAQAPAQVIYRGRTFYPARATSATSNGYTRAAGFSYEAGFARTARYPNWPAQATPFGYAGFTPGYPGMLGPGYAGGAGYWSGVNPAFGYGYPGYGFGYGGYGYRGGYPVGPLGVGGPMSYPGFGAGFGGAAPSYGYRYRGYYPW